MLINLQGILWADMSSDKAIVADPSVQREDLQSAGLGAKEGRQAREAREARELVHVAVGVLLRSDGAFLLTSRPSGKPYAGYWEFPGGKFEPGEVGRQALARELKEELNIDIDVPSTQEWRVQRVDYPHALVELHFFKVFAFTGVIEPLEGQMLAWSDLPVQVTPVLPGTVPVLEWLALERGFNGQTYRQSSSIA